MEEQIQQINPVATDALQIKESRNIITLRTSGKDQNPENQLSDCLELGKSLKLSDCEVLEEQKSAFKDDVKREVFDSIIERIKKRQVDNLLCWDLDRLYRDRKKLVAFFELCKIYNCKIYSFRQRWLEELNNIPAPFNDIMHSLMLQIMGWLAFEESSKRSSRILNSVRLTCPNCNERNAGNALVCVKCQTSLTNVKAVSHRGKTWGRRHKPFDINYILELHKEGLNSYQIAKKYSDNPKLKCKISHMTVFNIIKKHEAEPKPNLV